MRRRDFLLRESTQSEYSKTSACLPDSSQAAKRLQENSHVARIHENHVIDVRIEM
jgi:hypothetical protein